MGWMLPALVVLVSLLTAPATAQDFHKGLAAYERGDYDAALREWRPLAEKGIPGAQSNLGQMYANGQGVPQDYAEALKWYRLAAPRYTAAKYNLGIMYRDGTGAPRDYSEAAKWFRMAANQGLDVAQIQLGHLYDTGRGVPQNYVQAHMWYNLAAAQGSELGSDGRNLVAEKMTPADISTAQRMAREWLEAHPQKLAN